MTDKPTREDWQALAAKEARGRELGRETLPEHDSRQQHGALIHLNRVLRLERRNQSRKGKECLLVLPLLSFWS